ncbi:binary toxin-like calcium binding domain-containing protein [Listeria sp. PSOL-1]|uniref:binary toxin-like calcium binding domain-containing protein n=1 Tax=Listeria sp. PSOL-1 TaxID=1844999 RepID=UPI0013D4F891|nr:binary toxin-like calcium binding domain-containing protein [Listeria sp. PSOL-1]
MKPITISKWIIATALLAQTSVLPVNAFAEKKDTSKPITATNEKAQKKNLIGYYFKDREFKDPISIKTTVSSAKLLGKEKDKNIHSTRWVGKIKAPKTGSYTFSTTDDSHIIIKVDNKTILNQAKDKTTIQLNKDQSYEFQMEYRNPKELTEDLKLSWSIDGAKSEIIPDTNILSPDFSKNKKSASEQPLLPQSNLFDNKVSDLKDTDKDGIPNEWEEAGYTFKDYEITKWEDSFLELGYKKYISNPYKARTVADPYTDFEKVSRLMPEATKVEARDPLVAAYPAVGVGMEKLLFSKNENVSEGASGTLSKSVTDTSTTAEGTEVATEAGGTLSPFVWGTFKVSGKYTHSWTNTTATQSGESESWSSQLGLNTAESAYLNANVRYYNAGTAPIYELRPTSNFVFKNSGTSLTTITAGPNQIGNSLAPGATYPARDLAPISLDKANESGTVKIPVNKQQLDSIQDHSAKLNIETTQNKGQYGILNDMGGLVTDASKQWDPVRTNIESVSGSITLYPDASKNALERRVAARDSKDPEDKTPEITIGEAIKRAFNAEEKDGRLFYTTPEGKEVCIDESLVNLIGDEKTQQDLEKQMESLTDKQVYKAKWKKGMNLTLTIPTDYYDFENSKGTDWNATSPTSNSYTGNYAGKISSTGNGSANEPLNLKPFTNYTVRAFVYVKAKDTAKSNDITLYADSDTSGNGKGARQNATVKGNQWQVMEFTFNTGGTPQNYKNLGLKSKVNQGASDQEVYFDDISVTPWQEVGGENILPNGNFDEGLAYWTAPGFQVKDGYLTGFGAIFSKNVPAKPNTRYKVELDLRNGDPSVTVGNGSINYFWEFPTGTNTWQTFSYEFTTDNSGKNIFLSMSGEFDLDNVKIKEVLF